MKQTKTNLIAPIRYFTKSKKFFFKQNARENRIINIHVNIFKMIF